MTLPTKDTFTYDWTAQADYPNWTPLQTKQNLNARGEELRLALNDVVNKLNATTSGASGAGNVGATQLNTSSGATVQAILEYLKSQIDGVVLGQVPDGSITSIKAPTLAKYADLLNDFVVSGSLPSTSTTLSTTIPEQIAYVMGQRVDKASEAHTFTASKDTYVDLGTNGAYTYVEVANAAAAPAITANSIRMFKIVTDASTITTVTDLRTLNPKINKNIEVATDPITALGLTTKQYVDWNTSVWLVNGFRNIPVSSVKKAFTDAQKHGFFSNLPAGNNTIYTVPAGKKAFFWQYPCVVHNPTAGAIVVYTHIVPSGGTPGTGDRIYKLSVAASATGNGDAPPGLLNEGDSILLETDVAGLNAWIGVMEFDGANAPGYALKFLSNVGTAVTTVYTVPTGKSAMILEYPYVFNPTAAAITFTTYFVPSGGTAGSTNRFYSASVSAESGATPSPVGAVILNAGDFVQVVGSAAGCNFWIPVLEF